MPCANAIGSLPQNATKHQAPHLVRCGACSSRVVYGSRTRRDSAIIFDLLKTISLIYQYFNFAKAAKKCHFWQFTAPFGLQLRQMGASNKSIKSLIQVPKLFFETKRRPKLMFGRLFCSTLPLKYRFGAFFYAVFPLFPHFRTQ